MTGESEEVGKKLKIIGGDDPQLSKDCKTNKKLYKMR